MSMAEDYFRVTSVQYVKAGYAIFSGIPLKADSYKVNSGKYIIQIKSSLLPITPSVGQQWEVKGERSFGEIDAGDYRMRQHIYDEPEFTKCTLPDTGEQLIKFIANESDFKGIGESKARALWNGLKGDFHTTVKKDTPENRERLERILASKDSIESLFVGYAKYQNLADYNWMSKNKIPSHIQQRLIKHHKGESIDSINRNPYTLMAFGMSFSKVDELVFSGKGEELTFTVKKEDDIRLSAAIEESLGKVVEKGHTYTTQKYLHPKVQALLGSLELTQKAFNCAQHKAQFFFNVQTGTYHPTALLMMESVICKRLKSLAANKDLFNNDTNQAFQDARDELIFDLMPMQTEAILTALDNSVCCITGGAGTGKTTVLRATLRAFHKLGYKIHAVALSGRASMRLHESIGFHTKTIAALLRGEMIIPTGESPKHILVIDEASMVDVPVMYRIVNHIHPNTIILLSGDPDQLPPIGAGKVLDDIVKSGAIANTILDIVKRQEGSTGIPEYSKSIKAGVVPEKLSTGAITFHDTPEHLIAEKCKELYARSPYNSRIMATTKLMVKKINLLCQQEVNPDGNMVQFKLYGENYCRSDLKQNDTILFTQNHYEQGIQNGSLGTLTSVEVVDDSVGIVELDTGAEIPITSTLLNCMELGYCITLHKAQGSQFPRVIVALKNGIIADRAWLYTAITRAESEIHIVGSEKDFRIITELPSNSHKRNSWFGKLLTVKN